MKDPGEGAAGQLRACGSGHAQGAQDANKREKRRVDPRRGRGLAGENIASSRLKQAGYTIIDRNYRTRFGELDIVARKGKVVAFVEVKARSDESMGEPFEAVTRAKQHRIRRMAEAWMVANGREERYRDCDFRFDVISILLDSGGGAAEYRHLIDAFR